MDAAILKREETSYKKRRRISLISAVLIIACLAVAVMVPGVFADEENSDSNVLQSAMEQIGTWAKATGYTEDEVIDALDYAINHDGEFESEVARDAVAIYFAYNFQNYLDINVDSNIYTEGEVSEKVALINSKTLSEIIDTKDTSALNSMKRMIEINSNENLNAVQKAAKIKIYSTSLQSKALFSVGAVFTEDEIGSESMDYMTYATEVGDLFSTINGIIGAGFYKNLVREDSSPANILLPIIEAIAIGFAIIYGFIHAFQIFARGELNLDMGLKITIGFVLSFIVITYCEPVLEAVDDLGMYMVGIVQEKVEIDALKKEEEIIDSFLSISEDGTEITIAGNTYTTEEFKEAIQAEQEENESTDILEGAINAVGNFFTTIGGAIVDAASDAVSVLSDPVGAIRSLIGSSVMRIMMQIVIYAIACASFGLVISFALRRAFMPLALANVISEGMRSPGISYIKVYFSMYLEFAYFYLIAALGTYMEIYAVSNNMASEQTNTFLGWFGAVFCIKTACVVALKKSSELAKSVVGER